MTPVERFDGRTRTPRPQLARHERHRDPARKRGRAWSIVSRAVIERDKVCKVCGEGPRQGDPLTAGHKLSRALGGTDDMANLQAEHRSCNSRKGTTR